MGGRATELKFVSVTAIAVDGAGHLFLASDFAHRVFRVDAESVAVTPVAGVRGPFSNLAGGYSGDGGPATEAELWLPDSLAIDGAGNLFVADGFFHVRRIEGAAEPWKPGGGGAGTAAASRSTGAQADSEPAESVGVESGSGPGSVITVLIAAAALLLLSGAVWAVRSRRSR